MLDALGGGSASMGRTGPHPPELRKHVPRARAPMRIRKEVADLPIENGGVEGGGKGGAARAHRPEARAVSPASASAAIHTCGLNDRDGGTSDSKCRTGPRCRYGTCCTKRRLPTSGAIHSGLLSGNGGSAKGGGGGRFRGSRGGRGFGAFGTAGSEGSASEPAGSDPEPARSATGSAPEPEPEPAGIGPAGSDPEPARSATGLAGAAGLEPWAWAWSSSCPDSRSSMYFPRSRLGLAPGTGLAACDPHARFRPKLGARWARSDFELDSNSLNEVGTLPRSFRSEQAWFVCICVVKKGPTKAEVKSPGAPACVSHRGISNSAPEHHSQLQRTRFCPYRKTPFISLHTTGTCAARALRELSEWRGHEEKYARTHREIAQHEEMRISTVQAKRVRGGVIFPWQEPTASEEGARTSSAVMPSNSSPSSSPSDTRPRPGFCGEANAVSPRPHLGGTGAQGGDKLLAVRAGTWASHCGRGHARTGDSASLS
eukprot:855767-Prorocentrum_minimum.AAC.10